MTKAEEIVASLRQGILRGQLTPGSPLRQDVLAERFGVSHIPVREALRQLAAEGLVEIRRHQGARVSGLSASEARQLLEIRCVLETQAVRWSMPMATADEQRLAAQALDEAENAIDLDRWMHLNWRFHSTLYSRAARPRLFALIESVDAQIDRFIRVLISTEAEYRTQAEREHRAILAAYGVGNADAVCALLTQHMTETALRVERLLLRHRDDELEPQSVGEPGTVG
jgi:DNA-binding GntR family transcriptional regulator